MRVLRTIVMLKLSSASFQFPVHLGLALAVRWLRQLIKYRSHRRQEQHGGGGAPSSHITIVTTPQSFLSQKCLILMTRGEKKICTKNATKSESQNGHAQVKSLNTLILDFFSRQIYHPTSVLCIFKTYDARCQLYLWFIQRFTGLPRFLCLLSEVCVSTNFLLSLLVNISTTDYS